MLSIAQQIAQELGVREQQISATITLLDEGATVPFIARYRKEVTGGLTDTQLRELAVRLTYLRDLAERKEQIIQSIAEQGKLTDELKQTILDCEQKAKLEDIYLPYKPKRRTKAMIAKEAGLEPLALQLLNDPNLIPSDLAARYLNPEYQIHDAAAALEGAKQILMEEFSQHAELLAHLREYLWEHGIVKSEVVPGKEQEGAKFKDYFAYNEAIRNTPSHRALAIFRGAREGFLRLSLILLDENQIAYCLGKITAQFLSYTPSTFLNDIILLTWKIKILPKLELELLSQLREASDHSAIKVFSCNLKDLLMASPAGGKITMGLDPGLRTGVKVVVVDETGKLLTHTTIFPHPPKSDWEQGKNKLAQLCKTLGVTLISIGNGTASRETEKLVAEMHKDNPELKLTRVVVSEAGASVYSASELAAAEFPKLDVSFRGAVSIARRLQDPLAELVKIEPKAIGVGQYQHDVNQAKLGQSLEGVVEDCVNAVGVDLNRASVALLARVAGLNKVLAENIVQFRNEFGAFRKREELHKVPRFGEKTFIQAAGFLRISDGENPLDASGVHPETYAIVEQIIARCGRPIQELLGSSDLLKSLNVNDFVTEEFGVPTIIDIFKELEKPGRDPRPSFQMAQFKEGVHSISDLSEGMLLEGVVTNVTDFGAFIDIGVHQDGLVHKSMLANRFVSEPREIVQVGQIVKVQVIQVDIERKRISLSMRTQEKPQPKEKITSKNKNVAKELHRKESLSTAIPSRMADAFARAKSS